MSALLPFDSFGWVLRLALAQGVIVFFLLMNVVSFSLPHAGDFKPFFLLMAVYYWAIYRPTMMPYAYTFVLGIILDLLTHMPVGMNALLLLAIQALVRKSRLFLMGQPYIVVWLGFAIVALCNALGLCLLLSLALFELAPMSAFIQMLVATSLSILLFPVISLLLQVVHRALPVAPNAMRV
ncbi:MAG: rod shape-determining protein MreD [Micavibrio sp.]